MLKSRQGTIERLQKMLPEVDIINGASAPFLPHTINRTWSNHRQLEYIANTYMKKAGVTFKRNRKDLCQYQNREELVTMPYKNRFQSRERYYATLIHELIHSTGSYKRLNRLGALNPSGGYVTRICVSTEEMTAEIGSVLLLSMQGLDNLEYSAPYIKTWMWTHTFFGMAFRCTDPKVHAERLAQAVDDANAAVDYILNIVAS